LALSLAALATIRGSNYLLGAVLNIHPQWGIPLIPVVAAFLWIAPLVVFATLRDVGSFRLRPTWAVCLLLPVVAFKGGFTIYAAWPMVLPWTAWLQVLGKFVVPAMATGVFEEVIFRGYAFRRLPQTHPRLVVVTTALCFSLAHLAYLVELPVVDVLRIVVFALIVGLALSLIRMISGSLAWCMLLHGLIDAAQFGSPPTDAAFWLYWPYVVALVAVASVATLWLHPSLQPHPPADPLV
jgi:membrane protease YdiL (CAAX protease family)